MRTEAPDLSIAHDALHSVREELAHLFRGVCAEPASVGDFATEIRAHLLEGERAGWVEVQRLVERGWLRQFESCSELRAFLGKDRVLRKFGLITKIKGDTVKKRLILDAEASGISAVACKRERVILPRFSGHCQRRTGNAGPVSRG